MKLLEIWERIGKQPLKVTRKKEAIVFVDGNEYKISKIKYDNGKFIGFEAELNYQWHNESIKPKEDKWVVVMDNQGKEYSNHQWIGHAWYYFVLNNDGCDGWPSDINIISWRYQNIDNMGCE